MTRRSMETEWLLRRAAMGIVIQLPVDREEALAILAHCERLIRDAPIKSADQEENAGLRAVG